MKNQKTLFGLRLLKKITDSFIDTFFVLYFMDVSQENIVPLGIYQIIMVITVYFTIYSLRNLARTKRRIFLMRIAMLFDLIYFFTIIILQAKIVDFAYLLGLLRGLEEGFYYSVYNIMESDGVKNKDRARFTGTYKAVASAFSIILPIAFGSLIYEAGFTKGIFIIIAIVASRMVLSLAFRDSNLPRGKKTNLKKYRELVHGDQRFRWLNIVNFFNGLTASSSAFSQIITIYTLTLFSDSFSFGIFTAIFAAVSGIIGFLYAKVIKKKYYTKLVGLFYALATASLAIMLIECNAVTIILFKFWRIVAKDMTSAIIDNSIANLCNDAKVKREYKPEFYLNNEGYLVTGRVLSNILFISMAFMSSWTPIVAVFGVAMAIFAYSAVRFERAVQKRGHGIRITSGEFAPAYRTVTKK